MSAIMDLRNTVALNPGAETLTYPFDDLVALLQEIEGLQSELYATRAQRDDWQAYRTGSSPVALEPLEEWTVDDVIAITPEQLVRIVREAGRP